MNSVETKKNSTKGFVQWKVFCWAMGIVLILFGTAFSSLAAMNNRLSNYHENYTRIQVQLSQIQTDLVWIKNQLK